MHKFERAAKIMKELRGIKTALEIEVLQKAIDITDGTFRRLLKFIKPGVMEYEIEAEILAFIFKSAVQPDRPMEALLQAGTGQEHFTLCKQ